MVEFVIGMLSSVTATALTVGAGWLFSRRTRQWFTGLLARLTGSGVHRVYARQRTAEQDMSRDVSRARWIKILVGRGNELTRDAFAPLWSDPGTGMESIRILLPDPASGPHSWLVKRESELRRIDPGFHAGLLAEQVQANSSYLSEISRKKDNVDLRFYDLPNMYRVIATDEAAYITFYDDSAHGRNSPCICARRPGLMYDFALRLFSAAWAGSRSAEDTKSW